MRASSIWPGLGRRWFGSLALAGAVACGGGGSGGGDDGEGSSGGTADDDDDDDGDDDDDDGVKPWEEGDALPGAYGAYGDEGCGCRGTPTPAPWGLGLLFLLGLRRRCYR